MSSNWQISSRKKRSVFLGVVSFRGRKCGGYARRMSAGCGDDRGAVAQALVGVKLRFRWRTACGVLWCGVLWGGGFAAVVVPPSAR